MDRTIEGPVATRPLTAARVRRDGSRKDGQRFRFAEELGPTDRRRDQFVLERQGMTEEANEQYRKTLELNPESATAHYNLAASLARRGEFTDAERHFRAALDKKPDAPTYTGLGFVLWQQGRIDEAIVNLQLAIEAAPKHPAAYDQLGAILIEQGRLKEAESNYRLLVQIRPSTGVHHQKLAQVLASLGRTEEARKEMAKATAMEQNLGEAR